MDRLARAFVIRSIVMVSDMRPLCLSWATLTETPLGEQKKGLSVLVHPYYESWMTIWMHEERSLSFERKDVCDGDLRRMISAGFVWV